MDYRNYIFIGLIMMFLLNPKNLKIYPIQIFTCLLLSYFIVFGKKVSNIMRYIYNLRAILLFYFIYGFNRFPHVGLLIFVFFVTLDDQTQMLEM
jgi:hypothetical protein